MGATRDENGSADVHHEVDSQKTLKVHGQGGDGA